MTWSWVGLFVIFGLQFRGAWCLIRYFFFRVHLFGRRFTEYDRCDFDHVSASNFGDVGCPAISFVFRLIRVSVFVLHTFVRFARRVGDMLDWRANGFSVRATFAGDRQGLFQARRGLNFALFFIRSSEESLYQARYALGGRESV